MIECASNNVNQSIEYPTLNGLRRNRYFENGVALALPNETLGRDIDRAIEIGTQRQEDGEVMLEFTVLTFNAQTLGSIENRTSIEQQMIDNKILIAGFQESRSKKSAIRMSDSGKYINISAAKDDDGLGIEIWIATGTPIAKKGKTLTRIKKADVSVVFLNSRELTIHIQTKVAQMFVSVAHAPWANNNDTMEAAGRWWKDHLTHLRTHTRSAKQDPNGEDQTSSQNLECKIPIIWMVDANASPPYQISNLVGNQSIRECTSQSNICGNILNKFIKESAIVLHATFEDEESAGSKQGTFAKNGDPNNRITIDFVGTKGPIRYVNQTCRTIEVHQERTGGGRNKKRDQTTTHGQWT
jgi:hypothetical protein